MSIYSWAVEQVDPVPPEKEAVSTRIRQMKAGNWKALQRMSDEELAAFEREVDDANMVLNYGHPHNEARADAYRAIKKERGRRYLNGRNEYRAQDNRATMIHEAADYVRRAVEKVDAANKIEPAVWYYQMCEVPAVDVDSATDAELDEAAAVCIKIVDERPDTYAADSVAIAVLKGRSARAISSELSERGKARAERLEKARALLADITAEQARRERDRQEQEELATPEAMLARIRELEHALYGEDGA